MIRSASPHQRMILGVVLVGVAVLAALWMLALSPKRSESAEVRDSVAAQELRLTEATTKLAGYEQARKQYPEMKKELKRLDEAVPARGAIPQLLRQLQRRARVRQSELQVVALKPSGGAGASAPGLTPGAALSSGGLATLPFTFSYTGQYFDLVGVLKAARRSVIAKAGDIKIDGRLVTIEGLSFEPTEAGSKTIKASVAGTAYIAAKPPAPQPAADPAATATEGGS